MAYLNETSYNLPNNFKPVQRQLHGPTDPKFDNGKQRIGGGKSPQLFDRAQLQPGHSAGSGGSVAAEGTIFASGKFFDDFFPILNSLLILEFTKIFSNSLINGLLNSQKIILRKISPLKIFKIIFGKGGGGELVVKRKINFI